MYKSNLREEKIEKIGGIHNNTLNIYRFHIFIISLANQMTLNNF